MNKNALKIEKQLLNLFQLEETSDESDDDDITMKKIKLNGENAASVKQVGYVTLQPSSYNPLENLWFPQDRQI